MTLAPSCSLNSLKGVVQDIISGSIVGAGRSLDYRACVSKALLEISPGSGFSAQELIAVDF